ncbi:MAG: anthranilate phosphoribosyltransferase [Nocardioidaceae bacterium]|nr:anthranilate phosphoribosyltransferase [Nocardioidaceae bacterium]MDQ3324808.1 anthranilate phosphoribosyltransferase [Actinomycetota bacterium]
MSQHTWPEVLSALVAGRDLSAEQTAWAMGEVLAGDATPAQVAAFAVALRAKGETVDEVEGLVRTMYEHAAPIDVPGRCVDIVGTGGDRARTVNISTMAAVVTAGTGALVVKHGNRAASSASGAADVLAALGVSLDLSPARVAAVALEAGITFCFAPVFHSSLRHAAAPRRELGIATTFNFLGPLTNPVRPAAQAVGVADPAMAPVLAGVLSRRGVDALVFCGDDGLDELTITTTSRVWVARPGDDVQQVRLDPQDLGIARAPSESLIGGEPATNADVFRRVLAGEPGPVRDAVLLNAAAGVATYAGEAGSLESRLSEGMAAAALSIDSGAAAGVLEAWINATQADD